jgi:alkylation response protein AidB-like acyl-CoA dehydrogenase
MDFGLSKEQEMLKKEARRFLEKECQEELVREIEKQDLGYSPSLWKKLADLGWLGIIFPAKYGGMEGSIIDLMLINEEIGKAMMPGPYLSTVALCGSIVLSAGNEKQKSELLPMITKGNLIFALALTEPESSWGNDAWEPEGIQVKAVKKGEEYIINGVKLFVHDAKIANKIICVARTGNTKRSGKGITLFIIDKNTPGLECNVLKTIAGDKQCELIFNKVRVKQENILGEVNRGWRHVAKAIQLGAVMLCAQMVGAGEAILKLAVEHAKSRVQFDAPVGVNQYVQGHCTDLVSDIDGCKYVTWQAAWKLSENMPADYDVAVAKAWSSEAFERACLSAHSVLAGYGYTSKDGVLPIYSRRSKMQQLYLGNTEYWLGKVANELEKWTFERPKGKLLGLWKTPPDEETPAWQVWSKEDLLEV